MSTTTFLVILLFSCFVFLKSEKCDRCQFRENNIVPKVIPDVPKQQLTVEINQKTIPCGELVSTASIVSLDCPEISYPGDENTLYTLIMLDPDAPFPDTPLVSPYLHWFVINIPGDDVDSGDEQQPFVNPSPPPLSAPHRYIFVVYKQDKKLENGAYLTLREKFDVMDMMEKLNLFEISFGHYFNATSQPDAQISDALQKTKIEAI